MELVHAGLRVQGGPANPFERLRHCIRYNLAVSRNTKTQRLVFALIERFKGFIAAAMCHTYRFQIFLASSLGPQDPARERTPHGVWDVMKWVTSQLEPAYRVQANENVERAHAELENIRKALGTALLRDREAYAFFLRAVQQRKQLAAKVRLKMLDHLLQKRILYASERMRTALQDASALAQFSAVPDASDPEPFTVRRRLAKEVLERLDDQIAYLTEWHERLRGLLSVSQLPRKHMNEPIGLAQNLACERRAS